MRTVLDANSRPWPSQLGLVRALHTICAGWWIDLC